MSPFYLFLITAIFTSSIQIISIVQLFAGKKNGLGQIPLTAISLWAIGMTVIFSSPEPMLALGLLLTSFKIGALHLFAHLFTKRHINIPSHQGYFSIALSVAMPALLLFSPFVPELTILCYALLGILSTLLLLLYAERIKHVLSSKKMPNTLTWGVSMLTTGHFITFCYLIVMPSLGTTGPQWLAITTLLSFPFLHKGLHELKNLPRKFSISRPVVFHTTLFTIVGLYMLGLSGLSMLFDAVSLTWNYTTQLVLMGAFAFPLCYMLSSANIRGKILVWVNKHFFSSPFDYRDTWRKLARAMEPKQTNGNGTLRVLETMLSSINHQSGAYYQCKRGAWHCVVSVGESLNKEGLLHLGEFVDGITGTPWIVDTEEGNEHPERYPTPLIRIDSLRAKGIHWLVPVVNDDLIVGMWAISHGNAPSWPLNWETRDFTNALAHQMESYLKGKDTQQRLSEHAQFAAFNQTSAFVIHDMKNVYAQLSMINKNAENHKRNPEFVDDMLNTMNSMEQRVAKMLGQLTNKQRSQNTPKTELPISNWLKTLCQDKSIFKHGIAPEFVDKNKDECLIKIDKERLANVTKHLIDNAQHAAKASTNGVVEVSCQFNKKYVTISVKDNGVGMSDEFIKTKLFKPFETTKGNSGMGLGVYDAKEFAEQNGGYIAVDSEVNQGTGISLVLPWSGQE